MKSSGLSKVGVTEFAISGPILEKKSLNFSAMSLGSVIVTLSTETLSMLLFLQLILAASYNKSQVFFRFFFCFSKLVSK
jgi:hypothetical protein